MVKVEIIDVTSDAITVQLGPADALAISNALNEMCNGIGRDELDDRDFHARLGVFREEARTVLRAMNRAVTAMKERRLAEGGDW